MILGWLQPGPVRSAPLLDQPASTGPPIVVRSRHASGDSARLRVVVLDGLSLAMARELPVLNRFCEEGIDLIVDVGFPTVSLPVQSALWTGLTQQQSGLLYVVNGLREPLSSALPVHVPGSVAVVEAHPEIAASFGFTRLIGPPSPREPGWAAESFPREAVRAVGGDARLVFVHVLRIDDAGHAHGAGNPAYAAAAHTAAVLLEMLLRASPPAVSTRWVVLADHGHRSHGGHGGAEESIRLVRACIGGGADRWQSWPATGRVHLIDLARWLFEVTGVEPPAAARGRPLGFALAHADADATLPRPAPWRGALAIVLVAAGIAVAWWRARRVRWLPWWMPLSYGMVVAVAGPVTLSNPVVYPPWGQAVLVAALPGGLWCMVTAAVMARSRGILQIVATQIVPALAVIVATAVVTDGGTELLPRWTAHLSVELLLLIEGALAVALGWVVGTVGLPMWRRHSGARDEPRN